MGRLIKILSIDGGGIRGIIPAMILAEMERLARKPICKSFDLIAGTSTGGILALGLTRPGQGRNPKYSAKELVDLYEVEGRNIFSRSVWHRIRAMGNLAEEKYPADGLEKVLREYFGQTRLKSALTNLLVTGYEIERRTPFFFKSANAKKRATHDFPMVQVARATSAAPTYFEPARIPGTKRSEYYALVDGGVFANNPSMCAYVEAKTLFPKADEFLVVSLGTGELTRRLPYEEVKGWGLAKWAQPILSVIFDGVSDTVNYQMEKLLPPAGAQKSYYRFQTSLYAGNDDLDDAGPTNIRVLKLLAEEIIAKNKADLASLARRL